MIRHMRGRCTQSMEDIKMMIFRQQYRIQNLHQVRYSFDALEPPFSNDLRAFYNKRRRWTTRPNFGNMQHQLNLQITLITHPIDPCMSQHHHLAHPIHMQQASKDILTLKHPIFPTLFHLYLYRGTHVTYSLHISGDSRNFSQVVPEWACPVTIFFSSNSLLQFFLF